MSRKGTWARRSPCPGAKPGFAECDFPVGVIHNLPVSSPWTPSSRRTSSPGAPRYASASLRAGFARLPLQGGAARPPLTPPDGTTNPPGVGQFWLTEWVSFRWPFRGQPQPRRDLERVEDPGGVVAAGAVGLDLVELDLDRIVQLQVLGLEGARVRGELNGMRYGRRGPGAREGRPASAAPMSPSSSVAPS